MKFIEVGYDNYNEVKNLCKIANSPEFSVGDSVEVTQGNFEGCKPKIIGRRFVKNTWFYLLDVVNKDDPEIEVIYTANDLKKIS